MNVIIVRGPSRWWETEPKDGSASTGAKNAPPGRDRKDTEWEGGDRIVRSPLRPLIDDKDGYVVLGRSESSHRKWRKKATLDIGEVGEHQDTGEDLNGRRVFIDAAFPHIIFICGKRGSGKSYTLGILAEELARSAIGVGVVLIDPIGIFWSLKKENESAKEREDLARWGLSPHSFPEVRVLVPGNPESLALGAADGPFTMSVSEMTAEDWCQVFDMDRFKTQGLLIGTAIDQVRTGYTAIGESGSFRVPGKAERYSLGDIINCIRASENLTSKEGGFTPQTRRSLIARFSSAGSWGIFSVDGTPLSDVSSPNRVTVIDVSDPDLGDDKRSLITGIIARKILSARIYTARMEEAGGIETPDPERVPVTWLMLDEAHVILPHGRQTPATDALIEYAKQGRRPGCALVLATQRPASTSDEILSQVDILIGHNLALEDDMTALRRRVPAKLPPEFANSDFIRAVPVGTAIVADQRTQQRSFLIRLRPRMSHHAGSSAMPSALAEKKERVQVPISSTTSTFHDGNAVLLPTDGTSPVVPKAKGTENIPDTDPNRPDDKEEMDGLFPMESQGDPLRQLKDGNSAMIVTMDGSDLSDRARAIWHDRKFIVVSRTHPSVYPGIEGLRPEKVLWLSSTPSEISASPNAIQDLLVDMGRSLDSPGKKTVLFDGLDTLSTENDRRSVLKFFQALRERVFLGGHLLIVRVDPEVGADIYEAVSHEMDVILREGDHSKVSDRDAVVVEAPSAPPSSESDRRSFGSLAREDLIGMCRLMGISDSGTDDELLERLIAVQGSEKAGSSNEQGPAYRIGEMARIMRENSDLRDRIASMEAHVDDAIKGREGSPSEGPGISKSKVKGRSTSRKMRVVWEPETTYSEVKSLREGIEKLASELSEMKVRFAESRSERSGDGKDDGSALIQKLINGLEGKREEEMERISQLERSVKAELSRIRSGPEAKGSSSPMAPPERSQGKNGINSTEKDATKRPKAKLKVEKIVEEVPVIDAAITAEEAASIVKRTIKRSFFKGPMETVASVEPAYLPLIRCLVNYRSGLMNNLKSGDVFFDPVCGELILSASGYLRRTRGISLILGITPIERKTFDHLGIRGEEEGHIAQSAGITKTQAKRALGSLVKKGLAQTRSGEGNVPLYLRSVGFAFDEKPWKKGPDWHPKLSPLPKETILPSSVDDKLIELCMSLFGAQIRMMDKDRVLYPVYVVKVTGEGRTRHSIVDAVTGKVDPDLTEISRGIV